MASFGIPERPSLYSRTLRELRGLYLSAGQTLVDDAAVAPGGRDAQQGGDSVHLLDDLHRGLALKVYLSVCEADREWSPPERLLAEVLCHHLWDQWLQGEMLTQAMRRASEESGKLTWYALVRPFARNPHLHERVAELETIVHRMANLVARCDGALCEREQAVLKHIEVEMAAHLRQIPLEPEEASAAEDGREGAIEQQPEPGGAIYDLPPAPAAAPKGAPPSPRRGAPPQRPTEPAAAGPTLEQSLEELDKLIGLNRIKEEVRSLTNFLKLQQRRTEAGLPETDISLHMVFTGNPGTGKTTVARIVGGIFGALGVLKKGHLVETDRSGLVAEYAGQTGPKTNKKIDEALDGILFIDEAYSLISSRTEDPYGHEAIQALLKRAEDDRERLVVTLAGYPDEMRDLLRSNPGLSSRFSRQLEFEDYTPLELCRIFGLMCGKSRYELTPTARLKLILGLTWLFERRDRHFGNGRAARNVFEHAVRRMANRLAELKTISQLELVTLEADDIEFVDVPTHAFEALDEGQAVLHLECPACQQSKDVSPNLLGQRVRCGACEHKFLAEWGELRPAPEGAAATPSGAPS